VRGVSGGAGVSDSVYTVVIRHHSMLLNQARFGFAGNFVFHCCPDYPALELNFERREWLMALLRWNFTHRNTVPGADNLLQDEIVALLKILSASKGDFLLLY
jgi:hypothetical protein